MSSDLQPKGSSGCGFPGLLFVIFLVLKLTDNIDWSWWWVTSPLWIPLAICGAIALVGSMAELWRNA